MESEQDRVTVPPAAEVDNRMVQLALSSMATTLERIESRLCTIENQHGVTTRLIGDVKAAANLAGGVAMEALEGVDRLEIAVGRLAQSVQGLTEASRSLIETVYPERDSPSTPPDIELADVVPIHRRQVMTGE